MGNSGGLPAIAQTSVLTVQRGSPLSSAHECRALTDFFHRTSLIYCLGWVIHSGKELEMCLLFHFSQHQWLLCSSVFSEKWSHKIFFQFLIKLKTKQSCASISGHCEGWRKSDTSEMEFGSMQKPRWTALRCAGSRRDEKQKTCTCLNETDPELDSGPRRVTCYMSGRRPGQGEAVPMIHLLHQSVQRGSKTLL